MKKLRRTKWVTKFTLRDGRLPAEAYSPNGKPYPLVRIALPNNNPRRPLYYRPDATDGVYWVEVGYKIWRVDEWADTFAERYRLDVRNWDFFGEEIDIWEGYSGE